MWLKDVFTNITGTYADTRFINIQGSDITRTHDTVKRNLLSSASISTLLCGAYFSAFNVFLGTSDNQTLTGVFMIAAGAVTGGILAKANRASFTKSTKELSNAAIDTSGKLENEELTKRLKLPLKKLETWQSKVTGDASLGVIFSSVIFPASVHFSSSLAQVICFSSAAACSYALDGTLALERIKALKDKRFTFCQDDQVVHPPSALQLSSKRNLTI